MSETTKNFRHGHRERVRARFLREGLFPFADYEVLELLLFYAIPRRDTKEQAHALDDTVGSLYGVLTASDKELCRVPGIGARTAHFLRSVYPFMGYVAKEEPHDGICMDERTLADRIYPHLDRTREETALIAFLNNRDEIICSLPLGEGKSITQIGMDQIVSHAFAYRASSVVLADYKHEGIPFPESTVLQGAEYLHRELSSVGIRMRDYLLYTNSQYNSLFFLKGEQYLRSPSAFFLVSDAKLPPYPKRSAEELTAILSFVTAADKAERLSCALLEKYGTIATVLSLPYATLIAEYPDAENELLYLKILAETYSRAGLSASRADKALRYTNARMIGEMFSDILGMNCEETVALAMFDRDLRLIDVQLCGRGSVNTASFVMRRLVETALSYRASYVALAHNHPSGATTPSVADTALTAELFNSFHRVHISFIDHFVVTSSESFPITRREGLSEYTDMEDSFYK